jgi:bacteriorhodopsin
MLSSALRFLFGSGWFIPWHRAMWAGWLLVAPVPLTMVAEDALKTPPATPSLGTFGVVMMIALFYGVVTPANAGLLAGACRWPWWGVGLAALGAMAGTVTLLLWLLSAGAEGRRAAMWAAVALCTAPWAANPWMSAAAQGRMRA